MIVGRKVVDRLTCGIEPSSTSALTARILHIVWAIPCAVVSVVLATASGGHPPGLIFLPLALVVWALGHVGLFGATRLARAGSARRGTAGWPPAAILFVIIAAGLMTIAGLYLLVAGAITGRSTSGPFESAIVIIVWLAHTASLVGLLLRSSWGRYLAAACTAGWLAALSVQIVDHVTHARPVTVVEGAVVAALAITLAAVTFRLLLGRSEKAHTQPRDGAGMRSG